MTSSLQITPTEWHILLSLLHEHLPGIPVWAYGSRVTGTARPASDLDLVAFAPPDRTPAVGALREALAESNLPFKVDLHIWEDLPADFRRRIEEHHVPIHPDSDQPKIAAVPRNRPHLRAPASPKK